MDQTHIHLLITHLPIFGSLLGALVLAHGLMTKTAQTNVAGYYVLVLSAIGAGISYITGEETEESVENLPGVLESIMEEHEEFALFALIGLCALGVLALIGIYATFKASAHQWAIAKFTLVVALVSFGLVARTGYLGGQIRHTEIRTSTSPANAGASEQAGEEDDD